MNESLHTLPEAPISSVDWRLLVPFTDHCRILVGGSDAEEIAGYLNMLGTNAVVWPLDSHKVEDVVSSPSPQFDVAAIPLGFPSDSVTSRRRPHLNDLSLISHLLRPGGTILVGFSNRIGLRRRIFGKGGASISPGEMLYRLRKAKFVSVRFFGVTSQLKVPKYIFPLERQLLSYVFRHHFHHKLPGILVRWITQPVMFPLMKTLLPSYYVTASTANSR